MKPDKGRRLCRFPKIWRNDHANGVRSRKYTVNRGCGFVRYCGLRAIIAVSRPEVGYNGFDPVRSGETRETIDATAVALPVTLRDMIAMNSVHIPGFDGLTRCKKGFLQRSHLGEAFQVLF